MHAEPHYSVTICFNLIFLRLKHEYYVTFPWGNFLLTMFWFTILGLQAEAVKNWTIEVTILN